MKKMKTLVIVVVGILAALLIAFFALRSWTKSQIMDGDGMIKEPYTTYVYYSYGGGELGDSYTISLEDYKIEIRSCEGNGYPTETKSCEVDSEVYYLIDNIVYEYEMQKWGKLPKSEEFALDAPSTSLNIGLRNGDDISVSSYDEVPEGGWEAVREIVELLETTVK